MLNNQLHQFLRSGAIISIDKNTILLGYGKSASKTYSHLTPQKPTFYFPDFFLTKKEPWIEFEHYQEYHPKNLNELLLNLYSPTPSEAISWTNTHQKTFFQAFEELQFNFHHSSLQKAVPYAFISSKNKMSKSLLLRILKKALAFMTQYPFNIYGFWNSSEGMLGLTPETLFHYRNLDDNPILSTMALAGTCPNSSCLSSFKNDPKELHEHELAVRGILQSLQPFGVVSKEETQILSLPSLSHLYTPINVKLKAFDFVNLVEALHPTPALGAYPRDLGWPWLQSYQEKIERGRFGAPAGIYLPHASLAACHVAIRNVQWDHHGMRIGAGCGVVKQSHCDKEWAEINLKLNAIRELFEL